MTAKVPAQKRRARRVRARGAASQRPRLTVHRTLRHIYAQVTSPDGGRILAQSSTLNPDVRKELASLSGREAAHRVGLQLAERALSAQVEEVWFDRGRFRYHGRVHAVAEGAREGGLKF